MALPTVNGGEPITAVKRRRITFAQNIVSHQLPSPSRQRWILTPHLCPHVQYFRKSLFIFSQEDLSLGPTRAGHPCASMQPKVDSMSYKKKTTKKNQTVTHNHPIGTTHTKHPRWSLHDCNDHRTHWKQCGILLGSSIRGRQLITFAWNRLLLDILLVYAFSPYQMQDGHVIRLTFPPSKIITLISNGMPLKQTTLACKLGCWASSTAVQYSIHSVIWATTVSSIKLQMSPLGHLK